MSKEIKMGQYFKYNIARYEKYTKKMETEWYLQLCRALKDKIRNKNEEISVIHYRSSVSQGKLKLNGSLSNGFIYVVDAHFIDKIETQYPGPKCLWYLCHCYIHHWVVICPT
jgi:hypothetical protein